MALPAFDLFLATLTEQSARVVNFMAPGRALGAEFEDCDGIVIPQALRTLWSQMNGVTDTEGTILDDIWLDGQFYYFSIAEAREDYQLTLDLTAADPDMKDYFPVGFVPIATPGDGSRLLVNALVGSPTYGSVYDLQHGVGASCKSRSLDRYFETLCAALESGALFVDAEKRVDLDFDKFDQLARRMNPGCDAYDVDIPPAYETKEWAIS